MLFILSRACCRFRKGLNQYIFIILELAIGFTFIACQRNVTSAIETRLHDYERQYSMNGLFVNSWRKEVGFGNAPLGIDVNDYLYFSEKYENDVSISYLSYGSLMYNYIEMIPIIGMSEYAFQCLFDMDMSGQVYIGSNIDKMLKSQEITTDGHDIHLSPEGIRIDDDFILWNRLDRTQNTVTLLSFASFTEADASVSDCIIVSLEIQSKIQEYNIFYNNSLELVFNQKLHTHQLAEEGNEVISYLSERHNEYSYTIANKIEEYLSNSRSLSKSLKILSWVATYSLLLITAGITGVLLIMLDKRKKDISISLITGAVRWRLATELVLEVLFLCLCGSFPAIIASALITPKLSTSQYQAAVTWQSIALIAAMCVVITAFTSIVSMLQIKIKNPVDTLREA